MDLKKQEKYKNELSKVIKENKIVFFDHCFAFTSFSRATAYNYDLDKLDDISNEINKNRVKAKNYQINKWIKSDNATLQLAAYRLMSDSEEHQKLNQSYVDHSNKGKSFSDPQIVTNIITNEEFNKIKDSDGKV